METCLCPTCQGPLVHRCFRCSPGRVRTGEARACECCGTVKYFQPNQLANGEGRFCSQACHYQAATGVERVTGTTYIRKDGYRSVKVGVRRYKLEHRIVMEAALGRELASDEEVHHLNGDKLDNRLGNLLLVSPSEHQGYHQDNVQRMRRRITLTCEFCGASFERRPKLAGQRFCCRSCRSKAQQAARRLPVA